MDKEGWQEQAYGALRRWARWTLVHGYNPWTIERFRTGCAWAIDIDKPADERWWGPVVQRALREKIIRRKGFAPAKSSHGALKARYVGTRHA